MDQNGEDDAVNLLVCLDFGGALSSDGDVRRRLGLGSAPWWRKWRGRVRRISERVREQRRAWRASYLLQGEAGGRGEARGGEHGVVGVRSTVVCRVALLLQGVNAHFARNPLEKLFSSQTSPFLFLFCSFLKPEAFRDFSWGI